MSDNHYDIPVELQLKFWAHQAKLREINRHEQIADLKRAECSKLHSDFWEGIFDYHNLPEEDRQKHWNLNKEKWTVSPSNGRSPLDLIFK